MPKLGLGLNLAKVFREPTPTAVSLYSDTMDAAGTSFQYRQFWSSKPAGSVTYSANGKTVLDTGYTGVEGSGSGGHLIHYFDSGKDAVPTYLGEEGGVGYGPVYGGYYGHSQYTRTALGAGGGAGGWYPDYATQKQATDTPSADGNGWTRVRPASRTLEQGNAVVVNFSFKPTSPSGTKQFRFGVYRSNPATPFIATDDVGGSSSQYQDYRGYASSFNFIGLTVLVHKILARSTPDSTNLINSVTSAYTTGAEESLSPRIFNSDVVHNCFLKIVRPPSSNSLVVLSRITHPNSGVSDNLSYVDSAPLLNHGTYGWVSPDTFAAFVAGDSCTNFELSNVSANFETEVFINSVTISNASSAGLNGVYTRQSQAEDFARVGGGASIYFDGSLWYLFSHGGGAPATNSSQDLVSGTWSPFSPGIVATYGFNI